MTVLDVRIGIRHTRGYSRHVNERTRFMPSRRTKRRLQSHALKRCRERLPTFRRPEQVVEQILKGGSLEIHPTAVRREMHVMRIDGVVQIVIYEPTQKQLITVLPANDDRVVAARKFYG